MSMKIINVTDIRGFRLGNAEDREKGTGCTAIICEEGAVGGVDVRGGAPATRETDLLRSENTVKEVNAVVLSGGSAFGLEAASGVMRELASRKTGFNVGDDIYVPIVCGASLYDLPVAGCADFPDVEMGRQAARNAFKGLFSNGNHGAGTGASVGKLKGYGRAMKTGLGTFACGDGFVEVGAITALNAFGDIYNGAGNIIAGLRSEDGSSIYGTIKTLKGMVHDNAVPANDNTSFIDSFEIEGTDSENPIDIGKNESKKAADFTAEELGYNITFNTTISCLITNAALTKSQANKLASILHDAYARAIKPVHGTLDGDTVFVLATGKQQVNFDAFAALATDVLQYAIIDGAMSAESEYGLPAAKDLK